MPKRLMVTGYGGFLAGSVVKQTSAQWQLTGLSRSDVPGGRDDLTHIRVDLRETDELHKILIDVRPDVVIHTAAMAGIDKCQEHQDEAEAINV